MWLEKFFSILVDTVRRVTGGMIDVEKGGLRVERECIVQIFTVKQIGEKV